MTPITINVEQWKREGVALGATAMLVVFDRFPWPSEGYPVFVMPGEDIAARFAQVGGVGMQHISKVYLLPTGPDPDR